MARFFVETYGCQMNFSESDSLKSILQQGGHEEAETPEDADWVILNTCSVRLTAETRVEGRIGYYRGLNRERPRKVRVVLMGCMAQNVGEAIKHRFPDVVKLVWGTYNKEGILPYLSANQAGQDFLEQESYHFMMAEAEEDHPFKAFVPISHGCNNFCTYCIVPHVRGREVHRDSGEILDNIKRLSDRGVKEITLLGQNVNSYHDGRMAFPELLAEIALQGGIPRISFLTSHPKDFGQALADVIRAYPSIMPLIHLPFQSGSDAILQRMNRKYTHKQYLEKIAIARSIPGVVLTTDIMVGFPGESEEDYEATLDLVRQVRFYEAYMYRYNIRPGTAAEKFTDQVEEEIKLRRLGELIHFQRSIHREILETQIGCTVSVLGEKFSKKDKNRISGRTHHGMMASFSGDESDIGNIASLEITGVSGSVLQGKKVAGRR